jgi:protein-disulfide isomerase
MTDPDTGAGNTNSSQGKKDRRGAARETARIEREAGKKRQRRNRIFLQGGLGIGVIAIVAIAVLVVGASRSPGSSGISAGTAGPRNMASNGILLTGQSGTVTPTKTTAASASGKPTSVKTHSNPGVANIVTYVDWACPVCKNFEATYASGIAKLVASGQASLEVHPIAILDQNYAGSRYSSRAANAAACVANFAPTKFLDAQTAFYDNQPAEGSTGLTNSAMKKLLSDAGITSTAIDSCIDKETFKSWVTNMTQATTTDKALTDPVTGYFGTPTVYVNGTRWDNSTDFPTFVSRAVGSSGTTAPAPSPSK